MAMAEPRSEPGIEGPEGAHPVVESAPGPIARVGSLEAVYSGQSITAWWVGLIKSSGSSGRRRHLVVDVSIVLRKFPCRQAKRHKRGLLAY